MNTSTVKKLESYFSKIGLRELITEKHGKKFPATKTRNKNHKAVDGIWGTIGLSIEKVGYLPYHLGIKSDHCLIWFKIETSVALGYQITPSKSAADIDLILHHPRGGRKYISKLKLLSRQGNIFPRLLRL